MRWSRIAAGLVLGLLAALAAGPSWGQEGPADLRVDETKSQKNIFQSLNEFSGYGAYLGGMRIFGGTLGSKAQMKPILQGVFRYHFNEKWVGLGEFGFGWNSFESRADTVLAFTMGTLGAARRFGEAFSSDLRFSFGAGFYRWNYKWHGRSVRDNQTFRFYRGFSPGVFVGLEGERRATRHVTLVAAVQQHYVLTSNSEKFDSLFDRNYPYLSMRLGVNYHFSPYEGILWERKQSRTIRLESGKEGR